ncbi:hypothetical protein [Leekyejoonella antrihumi]|uniref:Uncharacterized protein n=1 Tax=Leekyejoonella antrihumi TaxID=1660198 RepID=A0A563DRH4_9MICO|nr:hypothetical protein [Leekyejoonella antrihumi]TWP32857.1 hypothetical protein FGL98_23105 [Leekyejoonella antrihumi]
MERVLNVTVTAPELHRMSALLAPAHQPFWGPKTLLAETGAVVHSTEPIKATCDTFGRWGSGAAEPHVMLDEETFFALSQLVRARLVRAQVGARDLVPTVRAWPELREVRLQADGHRFVWWPSLIQGHESQALRSYIEDGAKGSRHDEVPESVWSACESILPGARAIAGTFALGEDANCFSTVLAAADPVAVAEEWVQREPFEEFLSTRTRPGGRDDEPGTVMVWRSADQLVQHACITLGKGWVLNKPNQCWHSPRSVMSVRQAIVQSRAPGRRMSRRCLI